MQITQETITPKKAEVYLGTMARNRPLSEGTVNRYAAFLKNKVWRQNGETIKFDKNGNLIDGQHRLTAVIETGVPMQTFVLRGLPEDAFDTLDTGKKRSAGDVLALHGVPFYVEVAKAAREICTYRHGVYREKTRENQYIANIEILEVAKSIPELTELCGRVKNSKFRLISAGLLGAATYLIKINSTAERADTFLDGVITGERLSKTDVRLLLRERFMQTAAMWERQKKGLVYKAAKIWADGSKVRMLKFRADEAFPEWEKV